MYMGKPLNPKEYDTLDAFQKAYHEKLKRFMEKYK